MYQSFLKPGFDTLVIAVPFVSVLLIGHFRLDQIIAAPRRKTKPMAPAFRLDERGRMLMTDPDGRPWKAPAPR